MIDDDFIVGALVVSGNLSRDEAQAAFDADPAYAASLRNVCRLVAGQAFHEGARVMASGNKRFKDIVSNNPYDQQ